jgi:Mg/Co/Ni transporter MgtE
MGDDPKSKGQEKDDPRSKTWIKPGQVLNPKGRPKGSRNKLGEDFVSALQQDFKQHGETVIAQVREEKPDAYLKVIASILPKEVNVNQSALQELSDDELANILDAVRNQLLAGAVADAGSGSATKTRH